jgi:archaellum biogenesis protein FlaJ (TadC family)
VTLNARIRQIHRWLSLAFTVAVIANIVAMVLKSPAAWIGFLALVPLIPLLITGLYLFVSTYAAQQRTGRREQT